MSVYRGDRLYYSI